jgi:Lrp/AsnC family leucine-responsive transcriptional regulator
LTEITWDAASIRILQEMQRDGSLSLADLARNVGLSSSPCWRRLNELRSGGVIQRTVAIVDPLAIGLSVNVFVQVTLEKQTAAALKTFQEAVRHRPEVMECYLMSGEADYLLRVVVRDLAHYQRMVIEHLVTIPGVATVKSSFALDRIKYTTALPVEHLREKA